MGQQLSQEKLAEINLHIQNEYQYERTNGLGIDELYHTGKPETASIIALFALTKHPLTTMSEFVKLNKSPSVDKKTDQLSWPEMDE
jgi:hypothetical protein